MNRGWIIGLILAIVLIGGLIKVFANRSATKSTSQDTSPAIDLNRSEPKVVKRSIPEQNSSDLIEIKNFTFAPSTIRVKAGQVIQVTNRDSTLHTLTSDDGQFDTGLLNKDQPKTLTAPTKPGTYHFHCTPHPQITGTLIVE